MCVFALCLGALQAAFADNELETQSRDTFKVIEPGEDFFGKSYNELAGDWWNWALTEPIETNVVLDPDGSFCELNQKGKVWFLAGTFGGFFGEPAIADRTCYVPAGKAFFFPLYNTTTWQEVITEGGGCEEGDLPNATLLDRLRCDAVVQLPQAMSVVINGEPVEDLNAYLAQSPPDGYTQVLYDDNIFSSFGPGYAAGEKEPSVANGFWIFLKPLPRGENQVSFGIDFDDDGVTDLGANYTLIIGR
jgi:hypothetical protein